MDSGSHGMTFFKLVSFIFLTGLIFAYTGCPVNWYSLSISIPDFSDCPIKKDQVCQFNLNGSAYKEVIILRMNL